MRARRVALARGAAGYEAIEFADGRITNGRFGKYRVPRMRDLPKLDLFEIDRKDLPSVGAGETPIIAVAPAVANAIHHASGIRNRYQGLPHVSVTVRDLWRQMRIVPIKMLAGVHRPPLKPRA